MTYVMEQKLIEKINAQRAERLSFKQLGCWMGMYVEPSTPSIGQNVYRLVH